MIRLGKLTDYAIVIMGQLSKEETASLRSASYLSAQTEIPEPTVAKVLKLLAQHGLVESVRGSNGGYRLAKPAGQITAADMITAIEGPIALVACVEGSGEGCKFEHTCSMKTPWVVVNRAVLQALETVKLTDLVAPASATPRISFKNLVHLETH